MKNSIVLREQVAIADQHGAQEDVVQEVIHVEAPLDQSRVTLPPNSAVQKIRDVLHHDHE